MMCIVFNNMFYRENFVIQSAFERNRITPSGFMSSYDSARVTNSSCSTCVFRIKVSQTNCFVITFPREEFE